jgi:hypothetical protein
LTPNSKVKNSTKLTIKDQKNKSYLYLEIAFYFGTKSAGAGFR